MPGGADTEAVWKRAVSVELLLHGVQLALELLITGVESRGSEVPPGRRLLNWSRERKLIQVFAIHIAAS